MFSCQHLFLKQKDIECKNIILVIIMTQLKQVEPGVIQANAQCSCFGLGEIGQGWFLSSQKNDNNKNGYKKIDNLYDNLTIGEDKRGIKFSLKGNRTEKQMSLMPSHDFFPSMENSKKGKNPVQVIKTRNYLLIDLQKQRVNPDHKNQSDQKVNQKSPDILTNNIVPPNEGIQRLSAQRQRNQQANQSSQPPKIKNEYFLSSQMQQLKSPRFLSPKIHRKIEKSQTYLIDNPQLNNRAKCKSPKIYSLKKIEEKNKIKISLYPQNQIKPISNILKKQEIKSVNQDNLDGGKDKNGVKQKAKSELAKLKRYTSISKIQTEKQTTQSIVARRQKQFSKAENKTIKHSFSDCFKFTRNKLLRMDDMEEICSLVDEDEKTDSQEESIVLARLNDYGLLADLKTQDALTSYSKIVSPHAQNSPIETSNKRSFFCHYHDQFISE